jgi:hypothetical protein
MFIVFLLGRRWNVKVRSSSGRFGADIQLCGCYELVSEQARGLAEKMADNKHAGWLFGGYCLISGVQTDDNSIYATRATVFKWGG